MKDIVVTGAGKIGATVVGLLASTNEYQITLADRSPEDRSAAPDDRTTAREGVS
jgi:saccharopine dehydrogenase-like NADP-dependent oxidoreductase